MYFIGPPIDGSTISAGRCDRCTQQAHIMLFAYSTHTFILRHHVSMIVNSQHHFTPGPNFTGTGYDWQNLLEEMSFQVI